ncbi:AhpC/TSA family protein [Terrimonas sp. NA20]|uniref:AhpC/TSA family protein n=1 Tax=Terrimonas ginsenosidimutans TaxID=2908004 RepID=A0ABS9KUF6_9BACT|nr:TlpA disulfide reductase family protein [Terrimonas ginsenosidimutans]MCG2615953.1 AhpC/TSA family protein [Terrimonas ginsenosidimutans]
MFRLVSFILLTVPLFARCQSNSLKRQPGEVLIKGTLKNMTHPVPYIYIIAADGIKGDVDSVPVVNNQYSFRFKPNVPTEITLYTKSIHAPDVYDADSKYLMAFRTEPATVNIVSTNNIVNSKITGSKAHVEQTRYEAGRQPVVDLMGKYSSLYRDKKASTDTAGLQKLKNSYDSAYATSNSYTWNYLQSHPESLLRAYLLSMYTSSLKSTSDPDDIAKVESFFEEFSEAEQTGYFGNKAWKRLDAFKIPIGSIAPSFVQNDTLGKPVSLQSFRGKYVLIDFWASWCVPCRRENPYVVKAYQQFRDKNFTILSVSLDKAEDKDKWIKAINTDGLNWTHVSSLDHTDNEVAKLYRVTSIPQNFLLDPEGKIIAKNLREEALEEALKKFIN